MMMSYHNGHHSHYVMPHVTLWHHVCRIMSAYRGGRILLYHLYRGTISEMGHLGFSDPNYACFAISITLLFWQKCAILET